MSFNKNNFQVNLEKQKTYAQDHEYLTEQQRIMREFAQIDKNGDGKVTLQEMDDFLNRQGIDDEHRSQIIQELFSKLDHDRNGKIELIEFSNEYVDTKDRLLAREGELKKNLLQLQKDLREAQSELRKAKGSSVSSATGRQQDSLTLRIIRGENTERSPQIQVIAQVGEQGQTQQSRAVPGSNPIFSNQQMHFKLASYDEPLMIELHSINLTGQSQPIIIQSIDLSQLIEITENQGPQELWIEDVDEEQEGLPRLLVQPSFELNATLMFERRIHYLTVNQQAEAEQLQQVRTFINQMRAPFGFLTGQIAEVQEGLEERDLAEEKEEREGDNKYHQKEKQIEQRFDAFSDNIARRAGFQETPWLKLTWAVVCIFLVLIMLQMLKRNCFISLTVAMLALYVLTFPDTITRATFRGLVLMIAFSWVYDFVQLLIIDSSAADEDLEDGGNQYKLNRFVRLMAYITLIFKIIVVLVFWKVSLDFRRIIRNRRSSEGNDLIP